MEFVGQNHKFDDCMIVALHNACLAVGLKSTYQNLYDLSLNRGWYVPGQGFLIKFLDEAFDTLKLEAEVVEFEAKTVWYGCFDHKKVYLFIRSSDYEGRFPGHAMVAAKGKVGVKIHNPYDPGTGWQSVQLEIRKGKKHVVLEVRKQK